MPDEIKAARDRIESKIRELEAELARWRKAGSVLKGLEEYSAPDLFAPSPSGTTKSLADLVRDAISEFGQATTDQVCAFVLKRNPNASRGSIRATLSGRKHANEFARDEKTGRWSIVVKKDAGTTS